MTSLVTCFCHAGLTGIFLQKVFSPRRARLSADESPEATLNGEGLSLIPSPPEGEGKGEGDHLSLYYYETVNIS